MENKSLWNKILNILITVLTAIATTFGTPPAWACRPQAEPGKPIVRLSFCHNDKNPYLWTRKRKQIKKSL